MGNKETVLKYTMDLCMQGIRIDTSLLSDHRRRVIMMYIQEGIDEMDAKYAKPIPRATVNEVKMEDDSVPEESGIACHQEVMKVKVMKVTKVNRSYRLHVKWSRYTAAVLTMLKLMKRLVLFLNKSLSKV